MNSSRIAILAVGMICLATSGQVSATTVVGGIAFDDNAFADELISATAGWTFGGGASSLEDALVGSNPDDYAYAFGSNENVVLAFTDNAAINLSGEDLAIFELGTVESFDLAVSVGGTTNTYSAVDTGYMAGGYHLLVVKIDLDDFSIPSGGLVDTIQLYPDPFDIDPADFTVIGALNNVPEPGTFLLVGLGGLVLLRKRRK